MNWGAPEPLERGPIVVSRYSTTIRRRNGKSRCPAVLLECLLIISQLLEVSSHPVDSPAVAPDLQMSNSSRGFLFHLLRPGTCQQGA